MKNITPDMIAEQLQMPVTEDLKQFEHLADLIYSTAAQACQKAGSHDITLAAAIFLKLAGFRLPEDAAKTESEFVNGDGRELENKNDEGREFRHGKTVQDYLPDWTPEELKHVTDHSGRIDIKKLVQYLPNRSQNRKPEARNTLDFQTIPMGNNTWRFRLSQSEPTALREVMRLIRDQSINTESYRVDVFDKDKTMNWTAFGGRNKPTSIFNDQLLNTQVLELQEQLHENVIYWTVTVNVELNNPE